jgi:hypothetical protein
MAAMKSLVRWSVGALALAAGACVPVPVPVNVEPGPQSFERVPPILQGEGVAVLGTGDAETDVGDFPKCVREALASYRPDVHIVSAEAFRTAIYPWSVPQVVGWSEEEWAAEIRKSDESRAIEALRARYAVFVNGATTGSASGVNPEGVPVTAGWMTRTSEIAVTVVDLKSGRLLGTETARASGSGPVALMGVGFFSLALTEGSACSHAADRLTALLSGNPSSAKAK